MVAALVMGQARIPLASRWRGGTPRAPLCVVSLLLVCAEIARGATPGSGLVLTEDKAATISGSFVTTPALGATFQANDSVSGDGPLAIAIASTLPGLATASVSAASGQGTNWLQIAPLPSSGNCSPIADPSYSASIYFTLAKSQSLKICVVALPNGGSSVYAGMLSFQTQAGTNIVPVTYTVFPSAYLTVTNGNTVWTNGSSMLFQQPTNLNLRVTAQDPNSNSSINTPVIVAPAGGAKPNWLSISTNDLTSLPSTLTIGVDPTLVHQNQSTIVTFQALGGYGTVGFTFQVQPPAANPVPNPLVALWRPQDGVWYLAPPQSPVTTQWGLAGDVPVPGDYDGDRKIDFAVWRPSTGTWFIVPSSNPTTPITRQWGLPGDVPVPADYDGDGRVDFAVWRPSNGNWYVIPSGGQAAYILQWGLPGDIPAPADYGRIGHAEIAVWRPSNGSWYVFPNDSSPRQWGLPGDVPVPADYDADGLVDVAVWRPSDGTWYVTLSSQPQQPVVTQWGLPGDIPVPGDFDGDGKIDLTVWRPSNGTWYILPSTNPGSQVSKQWGLPNDVPLARIPGH